MTGTDDELELKLEIAEKLRGGKRLSPEEAQLAAEYIERSPPLSPCERRRRRNALIAERIAILCALGWKKEAAVADAAAEFNVARSTAFKATKEIEPAVQSAMQSLMQEFAPAIAGLAAARALLQSVKSNSPK